MRLQRDTLDSVQSLHAIADLPAEHASADAIERSVFLAEILECLSPDEHELLTWKKAGFSSRKIARHLRTSIGAVDIMFFRAKQKVREFAMRGRRDPLRGKGGAAK